MKLDTLERFPELKKHDKVGEDAKKLLEAFDFDMNVESGAAAVFHEWEFQLTAILHSYKIQDRTMRLTLSAPFIFDDFIYSQIDLWKDESKAYHQMCIMKGFENESQARNCLYMLTYTYYKAIESLTSKLGSDTVSFLV